MPGNGRAFTAVLCLLLAVFFGWITWRSPGGASVIGGLVTGVYLGTFLFLLIRRLR